MKGNKSNGIYRINGSTLIGSASLVSHVFDKTNLWHNRLWHVSEKDLIELDNQGLLCCDKITKLKFCETYVYVK